MKHLLVTAAAIAALPTVAMAAPCSTSAVSLTSWTTPGFTCEVGGSTFGSFTFAGLGGGISSDNVLVQATSSPTGPGLRFSSNGIVAANGGATDAAITYSLIAGGDSLIEDAGLGLVGSTVGGGNATVGEAVALDDGSTYTMDVNWPGKPTDHVTFPGSATVSLAKDAMAAALDLGDFADISIITQDFSLTTGPTPPPPCTENCGGPPPNVPEPASMALLGVGLLGLGITRWRTR